MHKALFARNDVRLLHRCTSGDVSLTLNKTFLFKTVTARNEAVCSVKERFKNYRLLRHNATHKAFFARNDVRLVHRCTSGDVSLTLNKTFLFKTVTARNEAVCSVKERL